MVLATKVAGPSRGMDWVRDGSGDLTPADIAPACDDSLRRLQTDVIDLYQIHWPERNVPSFGAMYFDPPRNAPSRRSTSSCRRCGSWCAPARCAHIGLSNETP